MMSSPSIIKGFEHKGLWWLPDKLENKIDGTLKFNQTEGAILELSGSFENIQRDSAKTKTIEPSIILGETYGGEKITLYKCFESNNSTNNSRLFSQQSSTFHAEIVFVGVHFQNKEEIKFKDISIHYAYLNEWFNNNNGFEAKNFTKEGLEVKYERPTPVKINIDDIFIEFRMSWSYSSFYAEKVSIEQKAYVTINKEKEESFFNLRKIAHHIQNFLSLGIGRQVYPLNVEGRSFSRNVKTRDGKNYYPSIEIYYRISDVEESFNAPRMIFTFNDIKENLESFLGTWIRSFENLEPFYNLYFARVYNSHMYLENEFLSLAQAIEVYHRRKIGGKYLSDEEYEPVRETLENAIPKNVPSDFKNSLKGKLKYGNEFPLRKRLRDIFENEKYEQVLNELIKDKKDFINKIADTRNYLVHYDEKLKHKALQGDDLYLYMQKLEKVIKACLLIEIGFSPDEVKNKIGFLKTKA